jgi:hypothetical protein
MIFFRFRQQSIDAHNLQVFGNVVNGQRIAGMVYIFQETFQLLQGFITAIDTTTGIMTIDNSQKIILNDVRSSLIPRQNRF